MILQDLTTVTELSNTLLIELTTSKEIHSLVFSHDNRYLFAVSESEVQLLACLVVNCLCCNDMKF